MKMIIKYIIIVVAVLIFLKLSTYGWRFSKKYDVVLSKGDEEIVENVEEIVNKLAVEIGIRNYVYFDNLKKTEEYIVDKFKDLGYDVSFSSYYIKDKKFNNIVAQLSEQDSDEEIIIGAHYDSCFNPGADDNASGIAGLLELARLLKNEDIKTNIKFIAFVNEEPPFFASEMMGSRIYAKQAKQKGARIKAAIIMDLIGYYNDEPNSQKYLPFMGPFYPNKADFITCIGNIPSRKVVKSLKMHFKKESDFPFESLVAPSLTPYVNFSDHWSFWQEGYPAVLITDTAFLRNKNYHIKSDLPDTLNYEKLAVMINGLKDAIVQFAND